MQNEEKKDQETLDNRYFSSEREGFDTLNDQELDSVFDNVLNEKRVADDIKTENEIFNRKSLESEFEGAKANYYRDVKTITEGWKSKASSIPALMLGSEDPSAARSYASEYYGQSLADKERAYPVTGKPWEQMLNGAEYFNDDTGTIEPLYPPKPEDLDFREKIERGFEMFAYYVSDPESMRQIGYQTADQIPNMLSGIIGGAVGGPAGAFALSAGKAGIDEYAASYEEAKKQLLSDEIATISGANGAAVEIGITGAFQRFAPGMEGLFAKKVIGTAVEPIIRSTIKESLKQTFVQGAGYAGKVITPEVAEEVVIEILHNFNREKMGIDPNAADFENQVETAIRTGITTVLATSMAGPIHRARRARSAGYATASPKESIENNPDYGANVPYNEYDFLSADGEVISAYLDEYFFGRQDADGHQEWGGEANLRGGAKSVLGLDKFGDQFQLFGWNPQTGNAKVRYEGSKDFSIIDIADVDAAFLPYRDAEGELIRKKKREILEGPEDSVVEPEVQDPDADAIEAESVGSFDFADEKISAESYDIQPEERVFEVAKTGDQSLGDVRNDERVRGRRLGTSVPGTVVSGQEPPEDATFEDNIAKDRIRGTNPEKFAYESAEDVRTGIVKQGQTAIFFEDSEPFTEPRGDVAGAERKKGIVTGVKSSGRVTIQDENGLESEVWANNVFPVPTQEASEAKATEIKKPEPPKRLGYTPKQKRIGYTPKPEVNTDEVIVTIADILFENGGSYPAAQLKQELEGIEFSKDEIQEGVRKLFEFGKISVSEDGTMSIVSDTKKPTSISEEEDEDELDLEQYDFDIESGSAELTEIYSSPIGNGFFETDGDGMYVVSGDEAIYIEAYNPETGEVLYRNGDIDQVESLNKFDSIVAYRPPARRYPSAILNYPEKIRVNTEKFDAESGGMVDAEGNLVDRPPVFLTGVSNDLTREAAKGMINLGIVIQPDTAAQYLSHLEDYEFIGIDNAAFSGNFNEEKFYKMLRDIREAGQNEKALYAVAPDVVGDWEATLEASLPHLDRIRDEGFPVGIVLQNGATVETVPWDQIDVLFVGGDNQFKLASKDDSGNTFDPDAELVPIVKEAKRLGIPIHTGRVNSAKRLEMMHYGLMSDSVDGTYLKHVNPEQGLETILNWLKPWGKFPFKNGQVIEAEEVAGEKPAEQKKPSAADIIRQGMKGKQEDSTEEESKEPAKKPSAADIIRQGMKGKTEPQETKAPEESKPPEEEKPKAKKGLRKQGKKKEPSAEPAPAEEAPVASGEKSKKQQLKEMLAARRKKQGGEQQQTSMMMADEGEALATDDAVLDLVAEIMGESIESNEDAGLPEILSELRETFDEDEMRELAPFIKNGWMALQNVEGFVKEGNKLTPDGIDSALLAQPIVEQEPEQQPSEAEPDTLRFFIASGEDVPLAIARHMRVAGRTLDMVEVREAAGVEKDTAEEVDLYQDIEAGIALAASDIVFKNYKDDDPESALITYDLIYDLYQRMPVIKGESNTTRIMNAFSTPLPLGFSTSIEAGVNKNSVVYDPTAGNGMLLVGPSEKLVANELDDDRADNLEDSLQITTTRNDALEWEREEKSVDVVKANPPFSSTKDDDGETRTFEIDGVKTKKRDHAIALKALHAMKDDGSAVLILGGQANFQGLTSNLLPDASRARTYLAANNAPFWNYIWDNYIVTDHYLLSGKLYGEKQKASAPVEIVVIKGRGKTDRPRPNQFKSGGLPELINSWDQVREKVEKAAQGTRLGTSGEGSGPSAGQGKTDGLGDVPPASGTTTVPDATGQGSGAGVQGTVEGSDGGTTESTEGTTGTTPPESGVSGTATGEDGDQQGRVSDEGESDTRGDGRDGDDEQSTTLSGILTSPKLNLDDLLNFIENNYEETDVFENNSRLIESSPEQGAFVKYNKAVDADEDAPESGEYLVVARQGKDKSLVVIPRTTVNENNVEAARQNKTDLVSFIPFEQVEFAKVLPTGIINRTIEIEEGDILVPYEPFNDGIHDDSIRVPSNQAQALSEVLAQLTAEVGDLKAYVAQNTGISMDLINAGALSASQIDAAALAIRKSEKGFIIGDTTGFGKGRTLATTIAYAKKKGMIPVFVTMNSVLQADMMRDLAGLGLHSNEDPFIPYTTDAMPQEFNINSTAFDPEGNQLEELVIPRSKGEDKQNEVQQLIRNFQKTGDLRVGDKKYTAIFTSYSQIAPQAGGFTHRNELLDALGDKAFLVLDESHSAAGKGKDQTDAEGNELPSTGMFVRGLLDNVKGVVFASATFADNPNNFRLYMKRILDGTSIDPESVPSLLAKGGDPMLQVFSQSLVEDGRYIRRDRDLTGVEFNTLESDASVDDMQSVAEIIRSIFELDPYRDEIRDDLIERGALPNPQDSGMSIDGLNFASAIHHVIDGVLSSMKVKDAAKNAAELIQKGEGKKVVAVFDKTMGSAIEEYENQLVEEKMEEYITQLANLSIDETREMLIESVNEEIARIEKRLKVKSKKAESERAENEQALADQKTLLGLIEQSQNLNDDAITSLREKQNKKLIKEKESYYRTSIAGKMELGVNFTLKTLLERYLERARKLMIREAPGADPIPYRIKDEDMTPAAAAAFGRAKDLIENSGFEKYGGSAIDEYMKILREEYGIETGEITGRTRIIKWDENGNQYIENRKDGKTERKDTVKNFNNSDQYNSIAMNLAGAEGISMHASGTFEDQRQRVMMIVQFPKSIIKSLQLLGRVDRFGQVVKPEYRILLSNAPAEKRLAAVFLKKVKSLNANVTSNTESDRKMMEEIPDVMNKIGSEISAELLTQMKENDNLDLFRFLQIADPNSQEGTNEELYDSTFIGRVTGRMVMAPVPLQERFWDELAEMYNERIADLEAAGKNPLTAKTEDLRAVTIDTSIIKEGEGEGVFGRSVVMERVSARNLNSVLTPEAIQRAIEVKYPEGAEKYSNRDVVANVMQESEEYIASEIAAIRGRKDTPLSEDLETQDKIDYLNATVAGNMNIIKDISSIAPGTPVVLTTRVQEPGNEENELTEISVPGILLSHDVAKETKNPTALSRFKATIAVLDGRKRVRVPYSSTTANLSGLSRYSLSKANLTQEELMRKFESLSKSFMQTRYIATGNVVAAFDLFNGEYASGDPANKGRLVFYTDSKGKRKPGVLMPLAFSPTAWESSRVMPIGSVPQAMTVLRASTPSNPISLRTFDGRVAISLNSSGDVFLRITKNRSTKALVADRKLADALGVPLVLSNKTYQAIAEGSRAEQILGELLRATDLFVDNAQGKVVAGSFLETRAKMDESAESGGLDGMGYENYFMPTDEDSEFSRENTANQSVALKMQMDEANNITHRGSFATNSGDERISMAATDLVAMYSHIFKVPLWVGGISASSSVLGYYTTIVNAYGGSDSITLASRASAMIGVKIHELGHALDKRHGIITPGIVSRNNLAMPKDIREQIRSLDYWVTKGKVQNVTGPDGKTTKQLVKLPAAEGRDFEGWAEFLRMYLTEIPSDPVPDAGILNLTGGPGPIQFGGVRASHPEIVEWFEGWLKEESQEELKEQISRAQKWTTKFISQPLANQLMAMMGKPAENIEMGSILTKEGIKNRLTSRDWWKSIAFRNGYKAKKLAQNDNAIFDLFDLKMEGANEYIGYTLAYLNDHLRFTEGDKARSAMELGVTHPVTGKPVNPSTVSQRGINVELAELLESKEEYDEANVYGWARHANWVYDPENLRFGKNYNAGMTKEQARTILDYYNTPERAQKKERFEAWARAVSDFAGDILRLQLQTGQISQKQFDSTNKIYRPDGEEHFYWPMQRIKDGRMGIDRLIHGSGVSLSGGPSAATPQSTKGLRKRTDTGSGENIEDPLVQMERQLINAYRNARINLLLQHVNQAISLPFDVETGWFAKKVDPRTVVKSIDFVGQIDALVKRQIIDKDFAKLLKEINAVVNRSITEDGQVEDIMSGLELLDEYLDQDSSAADFMRRKVNEGVVPDPIGTLSEFSQLHVDNAGQKLVALWVDNGRRQVGLQLAGDLYAMIYGAHSSLDQNLARKAFEMVNAMFSRFAVAMSPGFMVTELPSAYVQSLAKTGYLEGREVFTEPVKQIGSELGKQAVTFWQSLINTARIVPAIADRVADPGEIPYSQRPTIDIFYEQIGGSSFAKFSTAPPAMRRRLARRITKGLPSKKRSIAKRSEELRQDMTEAVILVDRAWQNFIAVSDSGNRKANLIAAAAELGYEPLKGGSWRYPDGSTGIGLPQEVAIELSAAAREANIVFKHAGILSRLVNTVSPFFTAGIAAESQAAKDQLSSLPLVAKAVRNPFDRDSWWWTKEPLTRKATRAGKARAIKKSLEDGGYRFRTFAGPVVIDMKFDPTMDAWVVDVADPVTGPKRQMSFSDDAVTKGQAKAERYVEEEFARAKRKHGDPKTKERLRAERTANLIIGLFMAGAIEALTALLMERDDWLNDARQREDYWTLGYNGTTILKVRKERSTGIFAQMGASAVEELFYRVGGYNSGGRNMFKLVGEDILSKSQAFYTPGFGGGGAYIRGSVSNRDYHDNEIVTSEVVEEGTDPYLYFDEQTSDLAVTLGYYMAPFAGENFSPMMIEYGLDQLLAGKYEWFSRILPGGDKARFKDIPALGKAMPFSLASQPLYDFREAYYDATRRVANIVKERRAFPNSKANSEEDLRVAQREAVEAYNHRTLINKLRGAGFDAFGKPGSIFDRYAIGVARDYLGLPGLPSTPSPFAESEIETIDGKRVSTVPEEVKAPVKEWLQDRARSLFPYSITGVQPTEEETLLEARKRARNAQMEKLEFFVENRKSPLVQEFLYEMLSERQPGSTKRTVDIIRERYISSVQNAGSIMSESEMRKARDLPPEQKMTMKQKFEDDRDQRLMLKQIYSLSSSVMEEGSKKSKSALRK